jgi:hypothetical protein
MYGTVTERIDDFVDNLMRSVESVLSVAETPVAVVYWYNKSADFPYEEWDVQLFDIEGASSYDMVILRSEDDVRKLLQEHARELLKGFGGIGNG